MENFGGRIREKPGFGEEDEVKGVFKDEILKNGRFIEGRRGDRYGTGIERGEQEGRQSRRARIWLDIA